MLSASTTAVKSRTPVARKILLWSILTILGLVGIHLSLQYANLNIYNEKNGFVFELSNRLDFDDEASVMTWVGQFQFLLLAAIALLAAYIDKQRVLKLIWGTVGVVAILFSIDETAAVHEFLLQRLHVFLFQDNGPTILSNSWIIILPVIALVGGLFAWQIFKHMPKRTAVVILIGGVIFIAGAVFVDMLTSVLTESLFVAQGIFVAIEESCELLGVALAIYATTNYVELVHKAKISKALRQLKD